MFLATRDQSGIHNSMSRNFPQTTRPPLSTNQKKQFSAVQSPNRIYSSVQIYRKYSLRKKILPSVRECGRMNEPCDGASINEMSLLINLCHFHYL